MSGSGRLRWIRRRRGTIACVAVLALIAIGYITFSFVHVDNGNTQQCVNTRTMKVADDSDCETGTGTGGVYQWYWGDGAQVGNRAHGGSFSDPDQDQGPGDDGGSGGGRSGGGSGGGDEGGGHGGGGEGGEG